MKQARAEYRAELNREATELDGVWTGPGSITALKLGKSIPERR
jgi:hypothetical protein